MHMHILIAGGSGFLGSYLIKSLVQAQHSITLLSRHPERVDAPTGVKVVYWDGDNVQLPPQDKPIDAVINLCGLSIARYWSKSAKQAIRNSRIKPSQTLVKWLCQLEKKPELMLQISGIDYYDMSSEQCSETDKNGDHFLAQLSKDWEATVQPLKSTSMRVIIARLAPVLAASHPPLQPLLLATKCCAGAIIGDGKQYFSWIHHSDFTNIIGNMLMHSSYQGIYNLCAPNPVPYSTLMQALAKACNRPLWLRVPAWSLTNTLGEMATLVVDSRKVFPKRLLDAKTSFQFPTIEAAMDNLCQSK